MSEHEILITTEGRPSSDDPKYWIQDLLAMGHTSNDVRIKIDDRYIIIQGRQKSGGKRLYHKVFVPNDVEMRTILVYLDNDTFTVAGSKVDVEPFPGRTSSLFGKNKNWFQNTDNFEDQKMPTGSAGKRAKCAKHKKQPGKQVRGVQLPAKPTEVRQVRAPQAPPGSRPPTSPTLHYGSHGKLPAQPSRRPKSQGSFTVKQCPRGDHSQRGRKAPPLTVALKTKTRGLPPGRINQHRPRTHPARAQRQHRYQLRTGSTSKPARTTPSVSRSRRAASGVGSQRGLAPQKRSGNRSVRGSVTPSGRRNANRSIRGSVNPSKTGNRREFSQAKRNKKSKKGDGDKNPKHASTFFKPNKKKN